MSAATARAATPNGGRYLQQLAKHWSHKMAVEFDERNARIAFPTGGTATLTASDDALGVRIDAADEETVTRLKGVVVEHLDRFAFREGPLAFDWQDG